MSEDLLELLKDLQQRYQIAEEDMEAVAQAIETEIAEASGAEMPSEEYGAEIPMEGEMPAEEVGY